MITAAFTNNLTLLSFSLKIIINVDSFFDIYVLTNYTIMLLHGDDRN